MPYLGIFARKFEKLLLYLKPASSNLPKCKKLIQNKIKEAILGPKMPYLNVLDCKFEKLLTYLKSAPSNL